MSKVAGTQLLERGDCQDSTAKGSARAVCSCVQANTTIPNYYWYTCSRAEMVMETEGERLEVNSDTIQYGEWKKSCTS